MLRFFKERAFLKDVETSMAFLLAFKGEAFVRAVYRHYPNAKIVAIEKMKEGEPVNKVASEILRIVLTDQITRFLSDEQRKQLWKFLASDEPVEAAPFPMAMLCRSYVMMMFRESDLKKLDEQWVTDCVHDVGYAAKGMSADERSNDRMMKTLNEALAGKL